MAAAIHSHCPLACSFALVPSRTYSYRLQSETNCQIPKRSSQCQAGEDANSPSRCRRRASTCTKQLHSGPPHRLRPGRTSPNRSRWGSRCMLRVAGWLPHSDCCSGRWRCAGWQPDDSVVLGSAAGMLSVRLPVGVFELGYLKPKERLRWFIRPSAVL